MMMNMGSWGMNKVEGMGERVIWGGISVCFVTSHPISSRPFRLCGPSIRLSSCIVFYFFFSLFLFTLPATYVLLLLS